MSDLFFVSLALFIAIATMGITDIDNKVRHINLALASEFAVTVGFTSLVIDLKDGVWFDCWMIAINFFFCLFFIHLKGNWQAGLSAAVMLVGSASIISRDLFLPYYFSGLLTIQILQIFFAMRGLNDTFCSWRHLNCWRNLHHRYNHP